MERTAFTLINPRTGELAFRIFPFCNDGSLAHLQRHNHYSLILITEGKGQLKANFSTYQFAGKAICCFAPYQPYLISSDGNLSGIIINFHADFFCIYRHQHEIASNGILFDNLYKPPFFGIRDEILHQFLSLIESMKQEVECNEPAQQESIILYLKLFLITAIRTSQAALAVQASTKTKEPLVLQQLQDAIETHHCQKHAVGEYADLLQVSPKRLARLVKTYYGKTMTELIRERLVMEAKRELYLTSKSVKSIAFQLGFSDEYYFSRFFKKNTDISPQLYRESVGKAKAERIQQPIVFKRV
ncbi:MAG: AraC family transcriptional regulator [Bacteroidetes bacterium]|nr:AraC family transcriptional regulator [Fibrella sp.]